MQQNLLNPLLAKHQHSLAVLGLGLTGASCVRFCLSKGLAPSLFDSRSMVDVDPQFAHLNQYFGEQTLSELKNYALIILSPGFPRAHPQVQAAIAKGATVVGDIELFALEVNAPVIAITGSNGKSTVTDLLGEMAKACGVSTAVGGNIGVPALDLLSQDKALYVIELSSFQLESTQSLAPVAATVLNLSEDHMDRYPSFEAYVATKHQIYVHAHTCVYNADDQLSKPERDTKQSLSFGISNTADFVLKQGDLCFGSQVLISSDSLNLVGQHNYANVLAAFALARAAGLDLSLCAKAAAVYKGLEHRCELVTRQNGVAWINDSKATNLGATLAAIEGLSSAANNMWLIAGGDSKQADLSELAQVQEKIAGVVAFGKDADVFRSLHPNCEVVGDLEQAVASCHSLAKAGDYVLLSPCCASLDMYKNYMARGHHFKQLVGQL